MKGSFVIDCFPESAQKYSEYDAMVVVDVIRATTTAVTAVHKGWKVYPARTSDGAFVLSEKLKNALLVGELGGNMPYGFHLTNSPVRIFERDDFHRPLILVSSSGIQLLLNAGAEKADVFISCLRNFRATARYLSEKYARIAILGAGTHGQFRREDQIGCAWVGNELTALGYVAENDATFGWVTQWKDAEPEEITRGRSAAYLRRSEQEHDLQFIVEHIDDLETVVAFRNGVLFSANEPEPLTTSVKAHEKISN